MPIHVLKAAAQSGQENEPHPSHHPSPHSTWSSGIQSWKLLNMLLEKRSLDLLPGQQFLLPRLQLSDLRWSQDPCPCCRYPIWSPSPAWEGLLWPVMRSYSFI